MGKRASRARRHFGAVRKVPSGRYQASYLGPDGERHTGRTGDGRPLTFDSLGAADAYLTRVSADIQRGVWQSPGRTPKPGTPKTLGEYAPAWLAGRTVRGEPLADLTRELYQALLDAYILPEFGGT